MIFWMAERLGCSAKSTSFLEDIRLYLHESGTISAAPEVEIFVAALSCTTGASVTDDSPDPRSGFDDEPCSLLLIELRGTFSGLSKSKACMDVKAKYKTGN